MVLGSGIGTCVGWLVGFGVGTLLGIGVGGDVGWVISSKKFIEDEQI